MFKRTVMFFIILGSSISFCNLAQADQLQSMMSCIQITEDDQRLSCFDAASKKITEAGISTAVIAKTQPTKKEQIANFGKNQLRASPVKKIREKEKLEEEKSMKSIKLTVVDIAYTVSKKFVLFMENGQIWKQKSGNKVSLPKGKFEVTIKKGRISGFTMIVPGKRAFIRVKRFK